MGNKSVYELISKAVKLEKGKVYSFFGLRCAGKTKLAVDLTYHLVSQEKLSGIFHFSGTDEMMYDLLVKYNKTDIIDFSGKLKWIFEENCDFEFISEALDDSGVDFLVIDTVFKLHSAKEKILKQEDFLSKLKALAEQKNIIIICTAELPFSYPVQLHPVEHVKMLSRENSRFEILIEQSSFAAIINRMLYDGLEFMLKAEPGADIVIFKSDFKRSIVHLSHLHDYLLVDGMFCREAVEVWEKSAD